MADKIVVLRGGRVEQIGAPLELYNHPHNRFVAGFIGSPQMNFLRGRLDGRGTSGTSIVLEAAPERPSPPLALAPGGPAAKASTAGAAVCVGIRPEHIAIGPIPEPAVELAVTIDHMEQLGAASFLYCKLANGEALTVHTPGQVPHESGEPITVRLPLAALHLFDTTDAERSLLVRDVSAPAGAAAAA